MLATNHYCEFLTDLDFIATWERINEHWQPGVDVRWRVWILRRLAEHASRLGAAFAEFGSYRGGCAAAVLSTGCMPAGRPFYLFDTFAGIPGDCLRGSESHLAGDFCDTSPEKVRAFLGEWDRSNIQLVVGDVFETLAETETGPLAFVHIDLNAAEPTRAAIEYAYPRLQSSGVMLFDDYGWGGDLYVEQRTVIDEYARRHEAPIIQLPTGTAMVIKP
jgi:hypothetical protein